MIWKSTKAQKIHRRTLWHPWFAWRPIRLARDAVAWLETVERRGGYDHRKNSDRRPPWRWEYRAALSTPPKENDQ